MPATNERSQELTGSLPEFSVPPNLRMDPDLPPEGEPLPLPTEKPSQSGKFLGLRIPKLGRDGIPTDTSSPGKADKADLKLTAELVATIVGLGFIGAAWVVRQRKGRKLRQPTKAQKQNMAEPLARIAGRHVPVDWLNADLVDLVEAGSAFGAYVNDGPLTTLETADPGVPADLNQNQENA